MEFRVVPKAVGVQNVIPGQVMHTDGLEAERHRLADRKGGACKRFLRNEPVGPRVAGCDARDSQRRQPPGLMSQTERLPQFAAGSGGDSAVLVDQAAEDVDAEDHGGVLERYPRLRVGGAELEAGGDKGSAEGLDGDVHGCNGRRSAGVPTRAGDGRR